MKPKIGIGVILQKDGKILLGKRMRSHGEGYWGFPGGHLEYGEGWEDCAVRETKEETNLDIGDTHFFMATNDIFESDEKHYITLFLRSTDIHGTLTNMEPEKCEQWKWFEPDALPTPLFLPIQNLLKQISPEQLRISKK